MSPPSPFPPFQTIIIDRSIPTTTTTTLENVPPFISLNKSSLDPALTSPHTVDLPPPKQVHPSKTTPPSHLPNPVVSKSPHSPPIINNIVVTISDAQQHAGTTTTTTTTTTSITDHDPDPFNSDHHQNHSSLLNVHHPVTDLIPDDSTCQVEGTSPPTSQATNFVDLPTTTTLKQISTTTPAEPDHNDPSPASVEMLISDTSGGVAKVTPISVDDPPVIRRTTRRRRKATSPPPIHETPSKRQRRHGIPPKPSSSPLSRKSAPLAVIPPDSPRLATRQGQPSTRLLRRRTTIASAPTLHLAAPALRNVADSEFYERLRLEKLAHVRLLFSGYRSVERASFADKINTFKEVALKSEEIRVLVIDSDDGTGVSNSAFSSATHVIAKPDENWCAKRTQKYLAACIYGQWIVRMDWIDACIKHNRLVPELEYEILGNKNIRGSAQLNRERVSNQTPSAFIGLKIHLCPTSLGDWHEFLLKHLPVLGCTVVPFTPEPKTRKSADGCRRRTRSITAMDAHLVPNTEIGGWDVCIDEKRPILVVRGTSGNHAGDMDDDSVPGQSASQSVVSVLTPMQVVPLAVILDWICTADLLVGHVTDADAAMIRATYANLLL